MRRNGPRTLVRKMSSQAVAGTAAISGWNVAWPALFTTMSIVLVFSPSRVAFIMSVPKDSDDESALTAIA